MYLYRLTYYIIIIIIISLTYSCKKYDLSDTIIELQKKSDIINNSGFENDYISFIFENKNYFYTRNYSSNNTENKFKFILWDITQNKIYQEKEASSDDGLFALNISIPQDSNTLVNTINKKYKIITYKQTNLSLPYNYEEILGIAIKLTDNNSITYKSCETDDTTIYYNKITELTYLGIKNDCLTFKIHGNFSAQIKSDNYYTETFKNIIEGNYCLTIAIKK